MSSVVTSDNCSRVFPIVGPDMHAFGYNDDAQQPGSTLLALGWRRLNPLQRWSGIGLDPAGRAGRLFLFHRLAIEAEMGGRFKRADFFWRETCRQLKRVTLDPAFWPEVLESLAIPADDPLQKLSADLSYVVISAVFIDTHHAWMHSYMEQTPEPNADSRAFVHLDYLKDYADLIELEVPAKQAMIGSATLLEIKASEHSGEWQCAENRARDLLHRFPEETPYQNVLAATYAAQANSRLKNGDRPAHNLKDATRLDRFIYKLKKLRLDYPHNLFIFDCIAQLHFLRAEKLAAAGQLAEALVDIQAALTYKTDYPMAEETRVRLEGEMQQIRIQMAAPDEERAALSKRKLKSMQTEAAKGFRLAESYKRTDEARTVDEDLRVAHGRCIWESVGLEPLARIDHRPLALVDAFETIFHSPPAEPTGIPAAWNLVSSDNPHLYSLEAERVFAYLNKRLYKDQNGNGVTDKAASESGFEVRNDPAPFPLNESRHGDEPFFYWLFSRENKLLKVQCLVAIVLVLIGARLLLSEFSHRKVRDAAYQQIHEARLNQDYTAMLDAAEHFLDQPVIGKDLRKTEVEGLYSEALLRWFMQEHPADDDSVRLERYRRLLDATSN